MVIPKAVRDEARLEVGAEIDVEYRDGRIEIAPAPVPMRLSGRGSEAIIEAEGSMPPLTADDVRNVLEHARR